MILAPYMTCSQSTQPSHSLEWCNGWLLQPNPFIQVDSYATSILMFLQCPSCGNQCLCLTNFIWRLTSNPKCHVTFFKTKMNVNWHLHFIPKCHPNFGLHNILGKLIFWIINMQSWLATKKNELSIEPKYPSVLHVSPNVEDGSPIHCIILSPQIETHIRASRVFKFNLLRNWFLIAFCLENPLSHCLALFPVSLVASDHCLLCKWWTSGWHWKDNCQKLVKYNCITWNWWIFKKNNYYDLKFMMNSRNVKQN